MLACLIASSVCEGLGLAAILPLLSIVLGETETSGFAETIVEAYALFGLSPTLSATLLLIVVLFAVKALILWAAKLLVGYATAQIGADLRHELISAITSVRWGYYVSKPSGALANSLTFEAENASNAYFQAARFVADGLMVGVYTLLAALVAWKASVAAVLIGLVCILPLHRFVEMTRSAGVRQVGLLKSSASALVDRLNSFKALKAMGRESVLGTVLSDEIDQLNRAKRHEVNAKEGLLALQEPVFVAAVVVLIYLAVEVLAIEASLLLMLAVLVFRSLGRVGALQIAFQGIARCEAAYRSLRDAIDGARAETETLGGSAKPCFDRSIAFRDLTFGYADETLFDGLDLEITSGGFTALVGPSGAGKTTIIDLIVGLVRPRSGEVWIDNVPLAEIDIAEWRRMIGYVPQEAVLFNDTLHANIVLGDTDLTEADCLEALRAAGMGTDIGDLPHGVHTPVGEKGMRFSGGQRQRIALARALVRKPKLLILDEATSALDAETERSVLETVRDLRGQLTIFAISHHPATVAVADIVFRMNGGTIIREQHALV